MTGIRESAQSVEINGEYVLRVVSAEAGARVSVAKVRRREFLAPANALIEAQARARGDLLAIEPIIDNVRYLVSDDALGGLIDALRAVRFGDRNYAAVTEDSARRAVLARIAAAGGSIAWEDACPTDLEATEFPLNYRCRDAIAALIERGEIVAVRARGQPPRLQLTAVCAQDRT